MNLTEAQLLVPDRLEFQQMKIYWAFYTQPSLGFRENHPKKRKHPASGSCVGENASFKSEVRQEWAESEMIEKQQ